MKHEIKKERLWVFAPVANIVLKTDISCKESETTIDSFIKSIQNAIDCAVCHNGILKSKLVFDESGETYLEELNKPNYSVTLCDEEIADIIKEQERHSFDIQNGEFVRFFIINPTLSKQAEQTITLVMIGHHLAGDGLAYTYLLQDIMKALCGETLEMKPVKLFLMSQLPKESQLGFVLKSVLKQLNRKWDRTGKKFQFEQFHRMYSTYWNQHRSYVYTYTFQEEKYQKITSYAKEKHITMNTLITTALLKAARECKEEGKQDVGLAVSIREKGYAGMGNFATGISVQHKYNEKESFDENGKYLQELIYDKLKQDKKKFLLLQFMGNITGSLVDAIYFAAVEKYSNKTAALLSKMFGYDGNPKGISLTNLGNLSIDKYYDKYELRNLSFIPPLVLNARRIIGVATLHNQMILSFVVEDNENKDNNLLYFLKAMSIMEELGE